MKRSAWLHSVLLAGLAAPLGATAQWRCDCTTITASCSASVSVSEDFVDVTTDRAECARVDYFLDGLPFVAVVVDGRERQHWLSRGAEPEVLVQSCQVCRDNAGAAPPAGPAAAADGTLAPLIEVMPTPPDRAVERGLSGHVELEYSVTPSGGVADIEVSAAEPAGVFDAAAIAALERWRYPADAERPPQRLTTRLEFPASQATADAPPRRAAGVGSSRPAPGEPAVNRCLREDSVYDYGDMTEVGLINACETPLAIHVCTVGVGPRQDRWDCRGSGAPLLVGRDDPRAAPSGGTGAGAAYTDRLFIARAPNSQYWWLACRADDAACRTAAASWLRSLDGQPASVDPQLRAPQPLARSY